ncbi:hypothetical protein AHAS_Ahas13G0385100 [Arachis hypogaea]
MDGGDAPLGAEAGSDLERGCHSVGVESKGTQEEQIQENQATWALAVESRAVLYDEEEDIMGILQGQNEKIAAKRRLAKHKEKARRSRPKNKNKVEDCKGVTSLPASSEEFKGWVNDMQLINLPLTDRKYTWFRGRSCSRIDRVLVNIEWIEKFPDIQLKGGPRGLSDHCPLILEGTRLGGGPRPFRSLDS